MKKFLLSLLGFLIALPTFARDFTYTYEGQTITYTVIDEWSKTCKALDGNYGYNETSGDLIFPYHPKDKNGEVYTLISIGDSAFSGCFGLTSISIPESVISIGRYAFSGCSGLTSISIPNSVTSIGDHTFEGCSGLTSISIPDSVTSIGKAAFSGCSGLSSITLPDSVTFIDEYTFGGCSGLSSITIPTSVTFIGMGAFSGCSGLSSIIIPDSVTSIDLWAFSGCSGLISITIPNSVTYIGPGAFSGCSGLSSITIPDSVTEIYGYTFYNCDNLETVTLPQQLEYLEGDTFYDCEAIKEIFYRGETPVEVSKDVFATSIYENATLHVPEGKESLFKEVSPWMYFKNIKGWNVSGVEEVTADNGDIDKSQPYEVYSLNGVKVGVSTDALAPGVYIVRQGSKTKKIIIN